MLLNRWIDSPEFLKPGVPGIQWIPGLVRHRCRQFDISDSEPSIIEILFTFTPGIDCFMPAIYINDMGRIIEVVSRNYMIVCLLTINKSINKMKKYLFLLSALLVYDYTFAQNQDTIKFENLVGLIKIPIQINGKEKYFMCRHYEA